MSKRFMILMMSGVFMFFVFLMTGLVCAQGYSWQGEWNSNLGKMALGQNGNTITGTRIGNVSSQIGSANPEGVVWTNYNIAGVSSGPSKNTVFKLSRDTMITRISTYHYFNNSTPAGSIYIKGNGTTYGPWVATGRTGQGGVKNAYWDVFPGIVLPAGNYKVYVSNMATWSYNSATNGNGMIEVVGYPASKGVGLFDMNKCLSNSL